MSSSCADSSLNRGSLARKSCARVLLVAILLVSRKDRLASVLYTPTQKDCDQNPVQCCGYAGPDSGHTGHLPAPATHNPLPAPCLGLLPARIRTAAPLADDPPS